MEAAFEHVRDNLGAYLVVCACAIPVLFVFRKHTGPVVFHTIEVIIYAAVTHAAFGGAVRSAWWFKSMTSMHLDPNRQAFTTPWLAFWKKDLYAPEALYYAEVVFLILIIFVVARYRPMSLGQKNVYKGKEGPPPSKRKPGAYSRRPQGRRQQARPGRRR